MTDRAPVLLLHGIGQTADAWQPVIEALPTTLPVLPAPVDLHPDPTGFTLDAAAHRIVGLLDREGIDRAHVCGLSLGAMVALRIAIDAPERTASLILSGGQVCPNRAVMAIQNTIIRMLPARLVTAPGLDKKSMLAVLAAVSRVDLRPELDAVRVPTLVLCGDRDRANLPAARTLAAGIPDAVLTIVPGAGHEWNVDRPREFARHVAEFVEALR